MRNDASGTVFTAGDTSVVLPSVEVLVPSAANGVATLRRQDLYIMMLTGDTPDNANAMGEALGIEDIHASVLPEEKLALIEALQAEGRNVLMVGDGLNDTAALAAAHASLAPGSALDASRNAADVVIVSGDLDKIGLALEIARTARRRTLGNFAIAALYNSIAVPIAVLGFATPLAAAIAMSTSSITVILNSVRGNLR